MVGIPLPECVRQFGDVELVEGPETHFSFLFHGRSGKRTIVGFPKLTWMNADTSITLPPGTQLIVQQVANGTE